MTNARFRLLAISAISFWLLIFAALPFFLMLVASFLDASNDDLFSFSFTFSHYLNALQLVYLRIFFHSLLWALATTLLCLLLAYPFAYGLAGLPKRWRTLCLLLIIIPFWTSSLIRTYAMMTLLKAQGLLNALLLALHVIHAPLHLLYTPIAVEIGLVYSLLPFMILPIYANLEKFDWRLVDAARDLGANRVHAFLKVVLPLSMPGIISGVLLVFLPAMTLFYIPDILGGAKTFLVGNLIQYQFLDGSDWPFAAALSTLLLLILLAMVALYRRFSRDTKALYL